MKECSKCKEVKSVDNFYKDKQKKDGLTSSCKICVDINDRKYKDTIDGKKTLKKRNIKSKYGLSWVEYLEMYNSQNGKCDICGKFISIETETKRNDKAMVDHSHITGQIRSLICHGCNIILGYCNDNKTILNNAIKYLEKYERSDL